MSWFVNSYSRSPSWRADRRTSVHLPPRHRRGGRRRRPGPAACHGRRRRPMPGRLTLALPNGQVLIDAASLPSHQENTAGHRPVRLRQVHPVPRHRRHLAVRRRTRCSVPARQLPVPAAAAVFPARHAAPCRSPTRGCAPERTMTAIESALRRVGPGQPASRGWTRRSTGASALSGGEQQRLAIARALLAEAGLAVPRRGHGQPGCRGRTGALPPAARGSSSRHHRLHRTPHGGCGIPRPSGGVLAGGRSARGTGRGAAAQRCTVERQV